MKRICALLLATVMCLSLVACGGEETVTAQTDETHENKETNVPTENYVEIVVESTAQSGISEETQEFDAFYAEGRKDRTELEFNTTYTIQDGLDMTATDCVLIEKSDVFNYYPGSIRKTLYFQITLENTSHESIYIRQDGIYKDGAYWLEWGSDVRANIEVKNFNEVSLNTYSIFCGTQSSPDASDYIFKYEELEISTQYVNCGNHICLSPGEQGEYYLAVATMDMEQAKQFPIYAIITFDNYDFFCDLSAIVETLE